LQLPLQKWRCDALRSVRCCHTCDSQPSVTDNYHVLAADTRRRVVKVFTNVAVQYKVADTLSSQKQHSTPGKNCAAAAGCGWLLLLRGLPPSCATVAERLICAAQNPYYCCSVVPAEVVHAQGVLQCHAASAASMVLWLCLCCLLLLLLLCCYLQLPLILHTAAGREQGTHTHMGEYKSAQLAHPKADQSDPRAHTHVFAVVQALQVVITQGLAGGGVLIVLVHALHTHRSTADRTKEAEARECLLPASHPREQAQLLSMSLPQSAATLTSWKSIQKL
jgi:hypothetical protein